MRVAAARNGLDRDSLRVHLLLLLRVLIVLALSDLLEAMGSEYLRRNAKCPFSVGGNRDGSLHRKVSRYSDFQLHLFGDSSSFLSSQHVTSSGCSQCFRF